MKKHLRWWTILLNNLNGFCEQRKAKWRKLGVKNFFTVLYGTTMLNAAKNVWTWPKNRYSWLTGSTRTSPAFICLWIFFQIIHEIQVWNSYIIETWLCSYCIKFLKDNTERFSNNNGHRNGWICFFFLNKFSQIT